MRSLPCLLAVLALLLCVPACGEPSDELKNVGDKVTLITGLSRVNVRGIDVHNQCSSCYLSSADPHGELK